MADLSNTWTEMTEAQLQSAVIEQLKWQGWLCYHTHNSRRSEPGFPDLVAVKGGRHIFVEFKTEKGKVKDAQIEWLSRLAHAHSEVYLVRPSTQDAFLEDVAVSGSNLEAHWKNQRG